MDLLLLLLGSAWLCAEAAPVSDEPCSWTGRNALNNNNHQQFPKSCIVEKIDAVGREEEAALVELCTASVAPHPPVARGWPRKWPSQTYV
ncbi:unnamed protein product [Lampetra fluviatilis]